LAGGQGEIFDDEVVAAAIAGAPAWREMGSYGSPVTGRPWPHPRGKISTGARG
jgi:hypothetical protein